MKNDCSTAMDETVQPWVSEYRTQGFVKLPRVFTTTEIDAVRDDFDRLFNNPMVLHEDSLRAASRESMLSGTVLDRPFAGHQEANGRSTDPPCRFGRDR